MGREDYVIVFSDGDANRAALLSQRIPAHHIEHTMWVRTVEETLDLLENYRERLKYVSLEHDLSDDEFVHSAREDCGMEIVRWLERQDPKQYNHVVFVVHTWNKPAGMKMTVRLINKGYKAMYVPFGMSTR